MSDLWSTRSCNRLLLLPILNVCDVLNILLDVVLDFGGCGVALTFEVVGRLLHGREVLCIFISFICLLLDAVECQLVILLWSSDRLLKFGRVVDLRSWRH